MLCHVACMLCHVQYCRLRPRRSLQRKTVPYLDLAMRLYFVFLHIKQRRGIRPWRGRDAGVSPACETSRLGERGIFDVLVCGVRGWAFHPTMPTPSPPPPSTPQCPPHHAHPQQHSRRSRAIDIALAPLLAMLCHVAHVLCHVLYCSAGFGHVAYCTVLYVRVSVDSQPSTKKSPALGSCDAIVFCCFVHQATSRNSSAAGKRCGSEPRVRDESVGGAGAVGLIFEVLVCGLRPRLFRPCETFDFKIGLLSPFGLGLVLSKTPSRNFPARGTPSEGRLYCTYVYNPKGRYSLSRMCPAF
jgi:hypothetical protein